MQLCSWDSSRCAVTPVLAAEFSRTYPKFNATCLQASRSFMSHNQEYHFDFVVVGSGFGGSVAA